MIFVNEISQSLGQIASKYRQAFDVTRAYFALSISVESVNIKLDFLFIIFIGISFVFNLLFCAALQMKYYLLFSINNIELKIQYFLL